MKPSVPMSSAMSVVAVHLQPALLVFIRVEEETAVPNRPC